MRRRAEPLLSFYARAEAEDSDGRRPVEALGGLLSAVRAETLAGRAASSLSHPSIVTVDEFGESEGLRSIVTEHVEGRTLRWLTDAGELSLAQALEAAVQIAAALAAAHRVGVVHRDVKPENVMVDFK